MIPDTESSLRLYIEQELYKNPKPDGIPMSSPNFGADEIVEAIDSMVTQNVTMGNKVKAFERAFADYVGSKHAVMVNSGSSANLIMVSAAANAYYGGRLMPGDEVIVPALTWSTTVWPILQNHLMPVFVDCDPETLCIDVNKIEITERTKAIMVAHILGNGCDMDPIIELCKKHNLILLEDNCESLGSKYKGQQLGTFGRMGTYSFFFSHHITTIEGGMVVTDSDKTADLLRTLRAHGWTRDLEDKGLEGQYPDIDPRFMFWNLGYSLRPTEIQGAFGIHQIKKLDEMNRKRKEVSVKVRSRLAGFPVKFTVPTNGVEHTWFGFPIITDEAKSLSDFLNDRGIETRPIIAGNLARHPVFTLYPCIMGSLEWCDYIMDNGFYINSMLDNNQIDLLVDAFEEYFA